jgi:hypothetical protein
LGRNIRLEISSEKFQAFAMAKPPLSLIAPDVTEAQPPRQLGQHGLALWKAVTGEYRIEDAGGIEMLAQLPPITSRLWPAKSVRTAKSSTPARDHGPTLV